MATFEQRESGWWQAKIRRRGYPAQSRTFEKKADAEAWARGIESTMDRGVFVSRAEAERTTIREALERYLKEVTEKKKGKEQERFVIAALLRHSLAGLTLASLKTSHLAAFRDEEEKRGVSPSTIRKPLSLLSSLYSVASKDWGIEVENPVKKIRMPKVENARERRLSPEEERYLLAAADDPGDSVKTKTAGDRRNPWTPKIIRFAIETAMRQGEILALDWKNVDLKARTAHLPKTKNGDARTVPLSTAAAALIDGDDKVKRLMKGRVFPTTASALKQSFNRAVARGRRLYLAYCETAKSEPIPGFLEDLTFHDLRHEGTSRLAEKLQLHELMRVTGHKDTRMLARYYHPRAEDLARKLG